MIFHYSFWTSYTALSPGPHTGHTCPWIIDLTLPFHGTLCSLCLYKLQYHSLSGLMPTSAGSALLGTNVHVCRVAIDVWRHRRRNPCMSQERLWRGKRVWVEQLFTVDTAPGNDLDIGSQQFWLFSLLSQGKAFKYQLSQQQQEVLSLWNKTEGTGSEGSFAPLEPLSQYCQHLVRWL